MRNFTIYHALVVICGNISSIGAMSFVSRGSRNLKSDAPSLRIKNQISNHVMSMTLCTLAMPFISLESIQSTVSQAVEISQNPSVEAEVFRDLAHATLDVATLFSLNPIVLRLFVFVGRIFSILSDYLPDHYMTPDETIFQLTMLLISTRSLYSNTTKLISSCTKSMSYKDRKIFLIAFLPVGFSWMQYKTLISSALEWVELSPGMCLQEENDSLFLVYKGQVYQDLDGSSLYRYGTSKQTKELDMVGNLSLAKQLIDSRLFTKKKNHVKHAPLDVNRESCSRYRLKAGSDGSLLLRIKVNKLLDIANEDKYLVGSMNCLVSNAIQNRLLTNLNKPQDMDMSEYLI